MVAQRPDLVFYNTRALTLGRGPAVAEVVAVRGGRVLALGGREALDLAAPGARKIDCQGHFLLPGFIDAHLHLLSWASSLSSVDCSHAGSIPEMKALLWAAGRRLPKGRWLKAHGYHESDLQEKRHPTRWELDEAVPEHPVRLEHRSTHGCVLNSAALALAGITKDTPDPVYGVIERDWDSGELTGLLLEMEPYLRERGLPPPPDSREMSEAIRQASRFLLAQGITTVHDASVSNNPEQWRLFQEWKGEGAFQPRLLMMPGATYVPSFHEMGLFYGSGDEGLKLGHAKVVLTLTTGALYPPEEELLRLLDDLRSMGFPPAIHAVEEEAIVAGGSALIRLRASGGRPRPRVEHVSEGTPRALEALRSAGAIVVTNPAFLFYSGDRYLRDVPRELQPHLYPAASMLRAGLRPAAGSDAPVTPPGPLRGMSAAVHRTSSGGQVLSSAEGVSPMQALRMHTLWAAYAGGEGAMKGSISPGKLADLVLVDGDPRKMDEGAEPTGVLMTVLGGEVVWEG